MKRLGKKTLWFGDVTMQTPEYLDGVGGEEDFEFIF